LRCGGRRTRRAPPCHIVGPPACNGCPLRCHRKARGARKVVHPHGWRLQPPRTRRTGSPRLRSGNALRGAEGPSHGRHSACRPQSGRTCATVAAARHDRPTCQARRSCWPHARWTPRPARIALRQRIAAKRESAPDLAASVSTGRCRGGLPGPGPRPGEGRGHSRFRGERRAETRRDTTRTSRIERAGRCGAGNTTAAALRVVKVRGFGRDSMGILAAIG
jgi:hypothetical protein